MRHRPRLALLAVAASVLAASATGCSQTPAHAGTLNVRIDGAATFTDEPSACVIKATALGASGTASAAVGSCASEGGTGPGTVQISLAPGRYQVTVDQYGCGMGQQCSHDPDDAAYREERTAWTCTATVHLVRDGSQRLVVAADERQRDEAPCTTT